MKREQVQEQLKTVIECWRNARSLSVQRDAQRQARQLLKTYPWLADFAALHGIEASGTRTKAFPWLAPPADGKTRHTDAPGRAVPDAAVSKERRKKPKSCATGWTKPPTLPGFEYRQCYKPKCHCMKGGAWHGPYRYHKKRKSAKVYSEYLGGVIANDVSHKT